jgi:hypothetical protein
MWPIRKGIPPGIPWNVTDAIRSLNRNCLIAVEPNAADRQEALGHHDQIDRPIAHQKELGEAAFWHLWVYHEVTCGHELKARRVRPIIKCFATVDQNPVPVPPPLVQRDFREDPTVDIDDLKLAVGRNRLIEIGLQPDWPAAAED